MPLGDTDFVPLAIGVTLPMLWFMEKLVAFVVVQESVEESPAMMDVGLAPSVQVGGGGGETTMLALQCTVPPAPVAVSVYVVLAVGDTDFEPLATGVTEPMP